MALEMDQFHDAFFEESFEAIEGMEAALLELDVGAPDPDLINTIFRVAHSIKGGSGMFGFNDVMSFTHTLETLLEELRSSRMSVTQQVTDLLLKSVDVLREMLQAVQAKTPVDAQRVSDLQFDLELVVAQHKRAAGQPAPAQAAAAEHAQTTQVEDHDAAWRIVLVPNEKLLAQGNDPLRMFAELGELGPIEVEAVGDDLPELEAHDPEVCRLSWRLLLRGDATRAEIEEVFAWAEGDCELTIERLEAAPGGQPGAAAAADVPPPAALAAVPATDAPQSKQTGATGRPQPRQSGPGGTDASSIRVSTDKIEELMNIVGEVVITQSMLMQIGVSLEGPLAEKLSAGLSQLERHVRELQESVMRVRMLPISFVFSRFPRLVRDLSQQLGKQVNLQMTGEHTELDKTVLEKIGDPLVHLVRNSVDHGVEMPDQRAAAGKPAAGTVHLNAYHRGGAIIVEVSDDGGGLNRERIVAKARERGLISGNDPLTDEAIYELMFMPGFSTAEKTTDISGRGVGMDVVRRNIAELGGTIDVRSEPGKGSTFTISLPLTLAIVDGQSVCVGREVYIVPLVNIVESLQLQQGMARRLVDDTEVFPFRGDYIPIIRLHGLFNTPTDVKDLHQGLVMVVEGDGRKVGIFVDELLGQQQVVIKSIEANYGRIEGVSGATILGEGSVALILDIPGLIRAASERLAA